MNLIKKLLFLIFALLSLTGYAQKTSIEFESNGRTKEETKQNPFEKFIGEWALKMMIGLIIGETELRL